jgi:hypothetical protein
LVIEQREGTTCPGQEIIPRTSWLVTGGACTNKDGGYRRGPRSSEVAYASLGEAAHFSTLEEKYRRLVEP